MEINKTTQLAQGMDMTAEQVFAQFSGMTESVAIYVPSTRYNKPVDNTEMVEAVGFALSQLFGGSTTYDAQGGYIAESGEYICEKVKVVKAYTTKVTGELAEKVISIAKIVKKTMEQECVSVEYNGKLMFV